MMSPNIDRFIHLDKDLSESLNKSEGFSLIIKVNISCENEFETEKKTRFFDIFGKYPHSPNCLRYKVVKSTTVCSVRPLRPHKIFFNEDSMTSYDYSSLKPQFCPEYTGDCVRSRQ